MEIENIDLTKLTPDVRYLDEMKDVAYDQEWLSSTGNPELYFMYRMLKEKNGLRYDITVIPAKMLGSEFVKTKGHIHAGPYGEIYVVLEGEGFFLFQKGSGQKIEDVYAIHGKKGDIIKVPPGYGHVTINPSNKELKMANWVKATDKGNFSWFEKMRGACYYYTQNGWIKNQNYKNTPELRFEKPLKEVPEDLNFLQ
jgi:glucose-6-phosphate isomerase